MIEKSRRMGMKFVTTDDPERELIEGKPELWQLVKCVGISKPLLRNQGGAKPSRTRADTFWQTKVHPRTERDPAEYEGRAKIFPTGQSQPLSTSSSGTGGRLDW